MNEAWAAIVAAVAAGVFGIGGVFAGLVVGRRQTTDEAAVEHGQWLRGQRLEAYTSLFTAWDQAVQDLRTFQNTWNDTTEFFDQYGSDGDTDILTATDRATTDVWARLGPYIERAELLGPSAIQAAAIGLREAYTGLRARLLEQASRDSGEILWPVWEGQLGRAAAARSEFHSAASEVLRTPATPKGDRWQSNRIPTAGHTRTPAD